MSSPTLEDDRELEVSARLLVFCPAREELDVLARISRDIVDAVVVAPETLVGLAGCQRLGVVQGEVTQEQAFGLDLHDGSLTSVQ